MVILFSFLLLAVAARADDVRAITAESLHARLAAKKAKPLVVDVREPGEFEEGHIANARLAPLAHVVEQLASVPKDHEIVLVCRSGRRSANAYRALAEQGYTRLWNVEGGMLAWEKLGYAVVTGGK